MDALVLGGGRRDRLARAYGAPSKAFIHVAARPMASWVISALREAGVGRVAFVGPRGRLEPAPDLWVNDKGGLIENVEAGLSALAPRGRVIVATADIPLLTAEAVRYLVENAPEAALVYPIVPKEAVEARFPGMKRTYARLVEGVFTGGNVVILDPKLLERAWAVARRVAAWRKNPLVLATLFGVDKLVKLLLGRLTVAELERHAERVLGVPARALITPYPEIGVDVDDLDDAELVARELLRRLDVA